MPNVFLDSQPIGTAMQASEADVNYVEIEPVTGVMYKMRRKYTMVLSFLCYERSTIRECIDSSS